MTDDPSHLYAQLVASFNCGNWQQAKEEVARLLPLAPRHAGVHGIAGVVSMELQQINQAVEHLWRATELDPTRADFATLYAKALSMGPSPSAALPAAERALALLPTDPTTLDTLGVIFTQAHAHERAAVAFHGAVARAPTHAPCRFNLANALVAVGDLDVAEQEFEACIALDPTYWNAHLSLAQLRRQTPTRNHLERLQSLLARHTGNTTATTYLSMALAKECEDLTDYPAAFEHLARGKAAARDPRRHSTRHDEAAFDALMRAFPIDQPAFTGDPSDAPIFVIGMPRSGTSLVERILSSHPDVYAAGELPNFAVALQQAVGARAPLWFGSDIEARMRRIDWAQLGASYMSSTRPATAHKPRFIDKLPHNFLHIGFIARALPNARIICLRRDPLDTCLSNFRQLFDGDSPYFDYSFDLLDAGRYYVLFDRLMAHWQRAFPGRMMEVHYETLVNAQEASSRQMLNFCGLPWHDACLHFETNTAPATTFSAVQVREPLYRFAVGRWKNYERQLAELRALLAKAGIPLDG